MVRGSFGSTSVTKPSLGPTLIQSKLPMPNRLRTAFGPTPAAADSLAAAARTAQETGNRNALPRFQSAWSQRGYLRLAHNGCSSYSAIVVNGPRRGEMWNENIRFVPQLDRNGCPEGFLAWYEGWLDRWLVPGYLDRWARAVSR